MKYCFNCGAKLIEPDQNYCIKCGTKLMEREDAHNSYKKEYRKMAYSPQESAESRKNIGRRNIIIKMHVCIN